MKQAFLRSVFGVAALAVSSLAWAQPTVRIYNWIEYLPPQVLKDFEQETGIRPIYDVFDSVEILESKLLTGNSGYDVVFPGSSNIGKLIQAKALEPLDRAQLPNWSHLDASAMKNLEAVGDTGNQYAVPYLLGTTIIGYNVDMVQKALGKDADMGSWDAIFKPENISKLATCGVGFLDAATEIIPIALHYQGLDPNSQKASDYKQAEQAVLKIRPYVSYFNSSRYGMDLANGDICAAVGWSGGFTLAKQLANVAGKGVKIKMVVPKEGAPTWSDVIAIPLNAPNAKEAHAFINYILRPDVIAKISNKIGYQNPIKDATALVDESLRNDPTIYIPEAERSNLYVLEPIPSSIERVRTRTWTSIKSNR